MHNQGKSTT